MKKIIMLGLLCLFLVACNGGFTPFGNVELEKRAKIEADSTPFTPASIESQERAKTKAKYIGVDTSNVPTAQIRIFNIK